MNINIFDDKPTRLFIILSAFFVANALIAELIGGKIFSLEMLLGFTPANFTLLGQSGLSISLSAGVLLWPVVFVMTDVINEYFGMRGVRLLTNIAVILIAYAFLSFSAAIAFPPPNWWLQSNPNVPNLQNAYDAVLSQSNWIIFGSLVAFVASQLIDVLIFHKIKKITGDRMVWLRATGSTLVSQLIDSYVVLFIAFYWGANWTLGQVIAIGIVNYTYKFLMAILLTPVIYLIRMIIERYLGKETAARLKIAAMTPKNR